MDVLAPMNPGQPVKATAWTASREASCCTTPKKPFTVTRKEPLTSCTPQETALACVVTLALIEPRGVSASAVRARGPGELVNEQGLQQSLAPTAGGSGRGWGARRW